VTSSGHARLGRGIVAGGLFAAAALIMWLVAISVSWLSACPGRAAAGVAEGVSGWPPGSRCVADGSGTFVHQAMPWAGAAIVVLLALAVIVLLAGIVGAARGLRQREERLWPPRVADARLLSPDEEPELARLRDEAAVGRPQLAVLLEEPVADEPRAKAA
jgi:hypothetical protein